MYEHSGHHGHVTWTILYKIWFPFRKEAPHKILLGLAKRFQRIISLKMVEERTDNGQTPA